ncbi:MAG: V-type ATP synthase subunit E [Marinilabiliaceae bacterium]|nr:V-type ATP synthase subunit E [Marinilabiliaceae bacterium]
MQSKLQDLTDKIYNEGVQKGKEEAKVIIDNANSEAEKIIETAKLKASEIEAEAKSNALEIKRNIEAEMKLAANQATSSIRQSVADMITMNILAPSVSEVFADKSFMKSLIEKVVKGWLASGQMNMKIILAESDRDEMEFFFKNSLAAELNKGVSVEFDNQIDSGFKIGPDDNSYLISFSDDDFINFFKAYLRPKTIQLLFEQK